MRRFTTLSTLLVSLLSAAVLAHADIATAAEPVASAKPVADFTVFLDPPTGFVFVKLPQGWKFAGKAEGATLASLPANVVTSLLPPDDAVMAESAKPAAGKL